MKRRATLPSLLCCAGVLLCLVSLAQSTSPIRVNGRRINDHLIALSKFGANPQGGVSRVAYTEADLQGRAYAISLMKAAGLDVRIDAAGNIVGARPGSEAALKPLLVDRKSTRL